MSARLRRTLLVLAAVVVVVAVLVLSGQLSLGRPAPEMPCSCDVNPPTRAPR